MNKEYNNLESMRTMLESQLELVNRMAHLTEETKNNVIKT